MDLYNRVSYQLSQTITERYSSSFSFSSRLFSSSIRPHIYAIYGLVRIADEIVDSYEGPNQMELLDALEADVYRAVKCGFSANPIVQSFTETARRYDITQVLIKPFFASMRMDLTPQAYTTKLYGIYIHGSAEVIGLMCLKVFCLGDKEEYARLKPSATALGAAYQKVNFLRDLAADYQELGRVYFPGIHFETMTEADKQLIIEDISHDFKVAQTGLNSLPTNSRAAVQTSAVYYQALLDTLRTTPLETITHQRIRISTPRKISLLVLTYIRVKVLG